MSVSLLQKIPVLIVGIVFLISISIIYMRSKHVTRSDFINIFKTAKRFQAWILICVIILTAFFGLFSHLKFKQAVNAVISLNYSKASHAQNANGTRYNMAEIICDDVLKMAIEKGAWKDVSVRDLKKCLSVYPYVQGGVQDESQYLISTEFVLSYYASKDTRHLDAENVIQLISTSYKDYYIHKYTDNFKLDFTEEKPDFSEMEYMDIVSYFNKESDSLLNYLYEMAGKSSSFVTENNTTFNSIAGKVFQFKENQIEQNLKSLILQNGIARDKAEYIDRLSYQNKKTDFSRRKNAISFDLCNQAIDRYAEEMTRVVLVPTWDESGKYYMGRTKVGIDELSVMATAFSEDVAANEKTIEDNNLIIQKVSEGSGSQLHESADALIESIDRTIKEFETEAIIAGREFSNHTMNQCIAVNISGTSLVDELKTIVLFAVFAYAALLLFSISKRFSKKA